MSHYKPYPAYRDSGVEWIGQVPEHWVVRPVKHLFEARLGKMIQPQSKSDEDVLVPYHRAQTVQWERVEHDQIESMWAHPSEIATYSLNDGDLLICEGGDVCRAAIFNQDEGERVIFQNSIHRVRPLGGNQPEWLLRLMQLVRSSGWIDVLCNKNTIVHFTSDKLGSLECPHPSPIEQAKILRSLHRETTRIDALITKKTRFIELLKEKRQALITHVVTKGLDTNAPLQNSGVEWIGDTPKHWRVVATKHVCRLLKDGTHLPPPRVDEGIPLLSVRNVQNGKFLLRDDDSKISAQDFQELCRSFVPHAGDVLLAVVGATLGKTAIISKGMGDFHIQRSLAIFRPNDLICSDFLHRLFESDTYQQLLWENAGFSAQPGIYLGALANFRIPLPPLSEQIELVGYMDRFCARIDLLTEQTQRSIDLLKERRATFITAAVTGQIDLREAA